MEHPLWPTKEGQFIAGCTQITGYRYPGRIIAVYCARRRHLDDRWNCDRHRLKPAKRCPACGQEVSGALAAERPAPGQGGE